MEQVILGLGMRLEDGSVQEVPMIFIVQIFCVPLKGQQLPGSLSMTASPLWKVRCCDLCEDKRKVFTSAPTRYCGESRKERIQGLCLWYDAPLMVLTNETSLTSGCVISQNCALDHG